MFQRDPVVLGWSFVLEDRDFKKALELGTIILASSSNNAIIVVATK
jgi:hypothetical protein